MTTFQQQLESLQLSEEDATTLLMQCLTEAEDLAHKNGAPINEKGEFDYDPLFDIVGYSNFGIHVREALLKRLPKELVALTTRGYPEHHLGRWSHIQAVLECFWQTCVALEDMEV